MNSITSSAGDLVVIARNRKLILGITTRIRIHKIDDFSSFKLISTRGDLISYRSTSIVFQESKWSFSSPVKSNEKRFKAIPSDLIVKNFKFGNIPNFAYESLIEFTSVTNDYQREIEKTLNGSSASSSSLTRSMNGMNDENSVESSSDSVESSSDSVESSVDSVESDDTLTPTFPLNSILSQATIKLSTLSTKIFKQPTTSQRLATLIYVWQNTHTFNITSLQSLRNDEEIEIRNVKERRLIRTVNKQIQEKSELFTGFIQRIIAKISYNRKISNLQSEEFIDSDMDFIRVIYKRSLIGSQIPSPYISLFDHFILPHLAKFYQGGKRSRIGHVVALQCLWDLNVIDKENGGILMELEATRMKHVTSSLSSLERSENKEDEIKPVVFKKDLKEYNQKIFVIDDSQAHELDDGISLVPTSTHATLFIHIANPTHLLNPNDVHSMIAMERGTSVYLPSKHYPMFNSNIVDLFDLGKTKLTFTFWIKMDWNGLILEYGLEEGYGKNIVRYSYDDVDSILSHSHMKSNERPLGNVNDEDVDILLKMQSLLQFHYESTNRSINDSPSLFVNCVNDVITVKQRNEMDSPSRFMVSEAMILAGKIAGKLGMEHGIPLLYRRQDEPWIQKEPFGPFYDWNHITKKQVMNIINENGTTVLNPPPINLQSLWQELQQKKKFGLLNWKEFKRILPYLSKSYYSIESGIHFGLDITGYSRCTSPLRRYTDLITHWQLRSLLNDVKPFYTKEELQEIIPRQEEIQRRGRIIGNRMERYYVLEWIRRCIIRGNWNERQESLNEIIFGLITHDKVDDLDWIGAPSSVTSDTIFTAYVIGYDVQMRSKVFIIELGNVEAIIDDDVLRDPGIEISVKITRVEPYIGLLYVNEV